MRQINMQVFKGIIIYFGFYIYFKSIKKGQVCGDLRIVLKRFFYRKIYDIFRILNVLSNRGRKFFSIFKLEVLRRFFREFDLRILWQGIIDSGVEWSFVDF